MSTKNVLTEEKGNGVLADVSGSVTRVGYVAMNKGEFDLSNMTFYNSSELEKAKRHWGNTQNIVRVKVVFEA